MDNLDLGTTTVSVFQPYVGEAFLLEEASPITLTEARELPHTPHKEGARQPFKLTFTGEAPMLLQGIRRLTSESVGTLEIFLVPIAGDGKNFTYEAVFN